MVRERSTLVKLRTTDKGRLEPFAAPFGYDRYVRIPAVVDVKWSSRIANSSDLTDVRFMGSRNGGRKRPPFHLSFDAPKGSGEPLSHGRARPAAFVQPIAIFRGWACFPFGRVSVNTPSSRLALIFS